MEFNSSGPRPRLIRLTPVSKSARTPSRSQNILYFCLDGFDLGLVLVLDEGSDFFSSAWCVSASASLSLSESVRSMGMEEEEAAPDPKKFIMEVWPPVFCFFPFEGESCIDGRFDILICIFN